MTSVWTGSLVGMLKVTVSVKPLIKIVKWRLYIHISQTLRIYIYMREREKGHSIEWLSQPSEEERG